jgi:predicted dehydrogenase
MVRIAVIGLGGRVTGLIQLMMKIDSEVQLAAVADPDGESVKKKIKDLNIEDKPIAIYKDADDLLAQADRYDAVMIGTHCKMHSPLAAKVASTGLPLFLEKPVAINAEQLATLAEAFKGREDSVTVSFPLRYTPLFTAAWEVVRSGRLGEINQVQAINNVSYGGVYFGQWYRDFDQVGGLWLQKATHDFDYMNLLTGAAPVTIAAMTTQNVFGGEMPFDLRCSKCDLTETCLESPKNQTRRGDAGGASEVGQDHACLFSEGIRNQDAGSAMIRYANAVHASYSQNFVTRFSAHTRGAIITGYDATLKFDWYTDEVTITDHHRNRVDKIVTKSFEGHSGGDSVLIREFLNMVRTKQPPRANLKAGLLSVAMCLAARESSLNQTFQRVPAAYGGGESPPADALNAV